MFYIKQKPNFLVMQIMHRLVDAMTLRLSPNSPSSHRMCGLLPGHANKPFATGLPLQGLPHGHLSWGYEGTAALARVNWWKSSTFPWAKCKAAAAALSLYSYGETHNRLVLSWQGQNFSLGGKRLSDWHRVSDAFTLWRGYVTLAALDQSSKAALRLLSGPIFLFFHPCPLREACWCYSTPGLTDQADCGQLWQEGPRLSHCCSVELGWQQKRAQESSSTVWGVSTSLQRLALLSFTLL